MATEKRTFEISFCYVMGKNHPERKTVLIQINILTLIICSVWECEVGQKRSHFNNNNPNTSSICCMEFANLHSDPLLIVGSGAKVRFI